MTDLVMVMLLMSKGIKQGEKAGVRPVDGVRVLYQNVSMFGFVF